MKKIKYLLASFLAVTAFAFPVMVATPAFAQDAIKEGLCSGANFRTSGGSCAAQSGRSFTDVLAKIVNIISIIVGAAAVLMIIFGGFRYITSGGDSGNISAAKNTILYAIIGLVIVALAQVIVRFVLREATV